MWGFNLVCGYTTRRHLLVDLDNASEYKATQIAKMIMHEWPEVGSCLLVKSSEGRYHLVFNHYIPWERIMHILKTLAALGIVEPNLVAVRHFRGDLTLRVSDKNGRTRYSPPPVPVKIIWLNGKNGKSVRQGIRDYLNVAATFINIPPEISRHVGTRDQNE